MSDNKKHIVINALHTKTGGGLVFFNNILPYLAKSKAFKITVVAHKNHISMLKIPKNVQLYDVCFNSSFMKDLLWEQLNLPKIIKNLGGDITFNIGNYGALLAPKSVVYVTSNPDVRYYASSGYDKIYWQILMLLTRLSILISPLSFCNGNYMKKAYASGFLSFLQKKMIKVTTACDTYRGKAVPKKKGQIVAIGDFYTHKNYDILLKAFALVKAQNKNATLIIIGRAVHQQTYEQARYLTTLLQLEDSVCFKGALLHTETKKILAQSEVYASPSAAEAFSLTLLEAMTIGTASVVLDYEFQKEVAGEKGAKYVDVLLDREKQCQPFAVALLHVLKNDNERQEMVKQAKLIGAQYSWKKSAEIITHHLKTL